MIITKVYLLILIVLTTLSGCSLSTGRYQQAHDSRPTRLPVASELNDAIPRFEEKSKQGNKSQYTVRGKTYRVLNDSLNYKQTGIASWYGSKFHGHLTSNGEIYDMYAMSAAHKSLPLPTYLKVTNVANNKSVIVRVNDRGPFHEDRLIDLSYSAAYKLDMLKTGTAKVTLEAITDFSDKSSNTLVAKATKPSVIEETSPAINTNLQFPEHGKEQKSAGSYIQVLATSNQMAAQSTALGLKSLFQLPVQLPEKDGIFRVRLGPISEQELVPSLLDDVRASGYPKAYLLNTIN